MPEANVEPNQGQNTNSDDVLSKWIIVIYPAMDHGAFSNRSPPKARRESQHLLYPESSAGHGRADNLRQEKIM